MGTRALKLESHASQCSGNPNFDVGSSDNGRCISARLRPPWLMTQYFLSWHLWLWVI